MDKKMTVEDVRIVIDALNDLKRQLGKAKMDLSVGWTRMAIQELDELENQISVFQRDVLVRKTIQVINSSAELVYTDE